MLQQDDQAAATVQDLVLSSLSLIVGQPREVISLDDHLAQTICASADDLSFEFIPLINEALAIRVPAAAWTEACTVQEVCALVASSDGRKPAHERQGAKRGWRTYGSGSRCDRRVSDGGSGGGCRGSAMPGRCVVHCVPAHCSSPGWKRRRRARSTRLIRPSCLPAMSCSGSWKTLFSSQDAS